MKKIDEIEAAARAATQGEWDVIYTDHDFNGPIYIIRDAMIGVSEVEHKSNARYISLCNPQTILALTADLRACREALEVLTHYSNGEGGGYFFEHSDWSVPDKFKNMDVDDIADQALQNLKKWGL